MLCSAALVGVRAATLTSLSLRRGVCATAASAQRAQDPIQQLFVDKVREYADKKKGAGGKLVDAGASTQDDVKKELEKVAKQFGGGAGQDMTAFPDIKFVEPKVDDINLTSAS